LPQHEKFLFPQNRKFRVDRAWLNQEKDVGEGPRPAESAARGKLCGRSSLYSIRHAVDLAPRIEQILKPAQVQNTLPAAVR
jgi:hypothetical protein